MSKLKINNSKNSKMFLVIRIQTFDGLFVKTLSVFQLPGQIQLLLAQTAFHSKLQEVYMTVTVYAKPSLLPDHFRFAVAVLNIWRP